MWGRGTVLTGRARLARSWGAAGLRRIAFVALVALAIVTGSPASGSLSTLPAPEAPAQAAEEVCQWFVISGRHGCYTEAEWQTYVGWATACAKESEQMAGVIRDECKDYWHVE